MTELKQVVDRYCGYPNIHECGCERGDDCTKTTMCHVQSAIEDSEETIISLRKTLSDALTEVTSGNYVSRAYRCQEVLEKALCESS